MNRFSHNYRPELTIIGEDPDPQSPLNPAADFLLLSHNHDGNQELQATLRQPGMPREAESLYQERKEEGQEAPIQLRAALAIGKLLAASNGGSRLDPDPETWGYITQDTVFSEARANFRAITSRHDSFENLRYTMTGRILAIFCLRTKQYLDWSEQDRPLKNTA